MLLNVQLCYIVLYCAMYCIVLYCAMYCIVLYCIVQCIVLCNVLYCVVVCIVMYCNLYCNILCRIVSYKSTDEFCHEKYKYPSLDKYSHFRLVLSVTLVIKHFHSILNRLYIGKNKLLCCNVELTNIC